MWIDQPRLLAAHARLLTLWALGNVVYVILLATLETPSVGLGLVLWLLPPAAMVPVQGSPSACIALFCMHSRLACIALPHALSYWHAFHPPTDPCCTVCGTGGRVLSIATEPRHRLRARRA